jgi:outer membrane protein assembly factor BamE (lipoprotein component of BamABCDE complex)
MMPKGTTFLATVVIAALGLAGCARTIDQRGNLPTDDKLGELQAGVSTRDDVSRLLGTPSSTGTFDDKTWYYISRRTEQFAFLTPELKDQQVVAISFDEGGIVRSVKRIGMDERRDIIPVARATPAAGKELSFMEQLIGNVGKFNRSSTNQYGPGPAGPTGPYGGGGPTGPYGN